MNGSPTAAALSEARLVSAGCADLQAAAQRQVKARIQQMKDEVDEHFAEWRRGQPDCWAEARCNANPRGCVLRPGAGGNLAELSGSGGEVPTGGLEPAAPAAAASASNTNNQVANVDEADFVKNDGRYVYLAMNGALRILEALKPKVLSVTKLPGDVRELFVSGDRAVVYVAQGGNDKPPCTYAYDCQFEGDGSATKILVFDITNRSAPVLRRELELSGSLLAARRIGNAIHTVVSDGDASSVYYTTWPENLNQCGASEATARKKFAALKQANTKKIAEHVAFPVLREGGSERTLCDNLLAAPLGDGQAYTTVASFDLLDDLMPAVTETIQSRPGAVFASTDALYLSVGHRRARGSSHWYSFYESFDEVSDVHKFRIGQRPSDTQYLGSGVVPGHVLNQFSMDEYYGYLRIATTLGRVPNPDVQSAISILAQGDGANLVRVGAIEGIARGEDIRAVRFDDDRGYIVTFKKTDPLFVADLYQPAHPSLLGELKIPGFSTYLHRIDASHLLSIGLNADDEGDYAYFNGVLLQLFDVTSATRPRLLFREKIGTRGSSSEALTNHLAFNYFAEKGLLAIPMTVCDGGGEGSFGNLSFSGLLVYRLSAEAGFQRLGGIDHGARGVSCQTWWSRATSEVKRSIFIDDLVYSIASEELKVQRLDKLGTDVASIALTEALPLGAAPTTQGTQALSSGNVRVSTPVVDGAGVENAPRVVAGMRAGFRSCFRRGLSESPQASGVLKLEIQVGAGGAVTSVNVVNSGSLPRSVQDCVHARAMAAQFDAPAKGSATVRATVTMVLQP